MHTLYTTDAVFGENASLISSRVDGYSYSSTGIGGFTLESISSLLQPTALQQQLCWVGDDGSYSPRHLENSRERKGPLSVMSLGWGMAVRSLSPAQAQKETFANMKT